MIVPTEDINLFELLDSYHKVVTCNESGLGWYFYDSDCMDVHGFVAAADHKLYETAAKAAYAACVFYSYI
jgi:hypothetical protein